MLKMTGKILVLFLLCSFNSVFAGTSSNELQEGRYVLIMMTGRATVNIRTPGIILDSYRGIVWTCQNLQDGKPLWVKTDLGKTSESMASKKKYVARMLEWQDADLRMPAVVLDIDDGIVWNCPNIIDGKATWIRKDLKESLLGESKENEDKK
jgi:hypothetical protein